MWGVITKEEYMLDQALGFMKKAKAEFDKQKFISDSRNTIYLPLFFNSFQHCVAVLVLVEKDLHSSSDALLRPVIETYLRAIWVKYCAKDNVINKLQRDKGEFPGLSKLLELVEKEAPAFQGTDFLTQKIKPLVSNMHDFTHGGIQSVAWQYSEESLSSIRAPEDVKAKIKFVVFITYLILCDTSESTDTDLQFYYDELQQLQSL
jgi:hypothetical protein